MKWRCKFDVHYADCLFALAEMKEVIRSYSANDRQLLIIVEDLIWDRYNRVLCRMDQFGVHDKVLLRRMRVVVKKELGIGFFLRRIRRKLRRSFRKRFLR